MSVCLYVCMSVCLSVGMYVSLIGINYLLNVYNVSNVNVFKNAITRFGLCNSDMFA